VKQAKTQAASRRFSHEVYLYASRRLRIIYLLATLAGLVIFGSLISRDFLSVSNFVNISVRVSFLLMMSIGMTLVIVSGGIDLSIVSVAVFSQILVAIILRDWGEEAFPIAILAAIGLGMIIGLINGVIVARLKVNPFIVTMSTMAIVRSLAEIVTGNNVIFGLPASFIQGFGAGKVWIFPILTLIPIIAVIGTQFLLNSTRFGSNVRGVGANYSAAKYLGIRADSLRVLIFVLSGMFAGIAGLMIASRTGSANPGVMPQGTELDAIAAPVIGGATFRGGEGSVLGTAVGAIIIGMIANLLVLLGVEPHFQQVVSGLIILGAVVSSGSEQIK